MMSRCIGRIDDGEIMRTSSASKCLVFLAALIAMGFFSGCPILSSLIPKPETGTLDFSIADGSGSKTLDPGIDGTVTKFTVTGSGPSGASFAMTDIAGGAHSKGDLAAGAWSIRAAGKNAAGDEIVEDSENITITAGSSTAVTLNCLPITGDGALSLELSWPIGTIGNPTIDAKLTSPSGSIQTVAMGISGTAATGTRSGITNGFYTLSIKLKDMAYDGHLSWSKAETVLIMAGKTTTGRWVLTGSDLSLISTGGISIGITSDSKQPIAVSLSGTVPTIDPASPVTVTASGVPTPDSWQWYLDGDRMTGQTSASITIGSSFASGMHSLDVIAKKSEVFGSSGFRFRIGSGSVPTGFAYTPATPVYKVDFAGQSSKTISVSGAVGKTLYMVKTNASSSAVAASDTGAVPGTSSGYASRESVPVMLTRFPDKPYRIDHAEATRFNENPPPILNRREIMIPGANPAIHYGAGDPAYTVDSTIKNFWVENAGGGWISIPATLRAIGNYCYIWVANDNFANSSTVSNDNKLTSSQISFLKEKFDGTPASSYNNGIFKNVTGIFGYEFGGGASGGGGRDADQHVAILVYDIDYDYSSSQSSGVAGYFWSKDYFSQEELAGWGYSIKTNYSEICYIDSHFSDRYTNYIVSTLVHEYQHMINFNEKSVKWDQDSPVWSNEMCSMVAEDLTLANVGLDPAVYGAQDRLPGFTYHYAESGVTDWLSGYDVMKSYAGAFAFGAYLERNYGGADLFSRIALNSSVGQASITAALSSAGYSETFETAFKKYGEALVFTDKPAGSSVKTLKTGDTRTVGGISYTVAPIDLATIQNYDLASSGWVPGSFGTRIYDTGTAVSLRPFGCSIHSGASWQSLPATTSITLNAPAGTNVSMYLMVK